MSPVQVFCLPPYCCPGGRDSSRVLSNKISNDVVHKVPCSKILVIFDGHESPLLWSVLLSHHLLGWWRRERTANRTWTTLQLLLLREERGEPSGRWDTDISSAELKIRTCLYCWRWTMLSSPLASHHPSVAGFKLWNEGEMMGETHGSTFHALKKK